MGTFDSWLGHGFWMLRHVHRPKVFTHGSTLLTHKEAILQCWAEHFEGLFSDGHTVQESSLAKIPRVDMKLELDDPPTCQEIKKDVLQLKVDKSPGTDGIPAEVLSARRRSSTQ